MPEPANALNVNSPVPVKLTSKENLVQSLKFLLFSISAGVIQELSFVLLTQLHTFSFLENPYWPRYIISLALSVVWNFTFNRRFTFKSAANVPVAMLKVLAFYAVFTPLSALWGTALTNGRPDWVHYAVQTGTMGVNLVTEFLYQRFVVFRNSINTNDLAKKEKDL